MIDRYSITFKDNKGYIYDHLNCKKIISFNLEDVPTGEVLIYNLFNLLVKDDDEQEYIDKGLSFKTKEGFRLHFDAGTIIEKDSKLLRPIIKLPTDFYYYVEDEYIKQAR